MNGAQPESANPNRTEPSLVPFARRVLVVTGILLTAVLVIVVFWFSVHAWLLLFAGVLLGIVLRGLCNWVTRLTRLPSTLSLITVILLLICLFGLTGWLLAPSVTRQIQQLSQQVPQAFHHLERQLPWHLLDRFLPGGTGSSGVGSESGEVLSGITNVFSTTFEALAGILIILFVGFYIAVNPALYVNGLVRLIPVARRDRAREVFHEVIHTLRFWMLGQVLSMTAVGVLIGIGLHYLGIPLALSLGILAGLLDCIPIAGPTISAVPSVLLAFVISPLHALYVIALYVLVIAVIESHVLLPIAQRFAIRIPQVVTIITLVMMWMLFGFLGVLLATPSAATAFVLIRTLYVEDVLGDRRPAK